jgi:transcription initiation factor TFIIIB Brf1 subunit/transcription initiation factor TFIIB
MKIFKICDCCKKKTFFMDMSFGEILCNDCFRLISENRKTPKIIFEYMYKHNLFLFNEEKNELKNK